MLATPAEQPRNFGRNVGRVGCARVPLRQDAGDRAGCGTLTVQNSRLEQTRAVRRACRVGNSRAAHQGGPTFRVHELIVRARHSAIVRAERVRG